MKLIRGWSCLHLISVWLIQLLSDSSFHCHKEIIRAKKSSIQWKMAEQIRNAVGIMSAFHLNGKIGFPGGKPNGTGLSTGNFSKKREYLQRYSSVLVFTGITGKSLYHLFYHTSAMLLGKNTRFRSRKWRPPSCFSVQHAVFSVLTWTPLSVIAVRLQVSVNCH